jgi:hypothetical protein
MRSKTTKTHSRDAAGSPKGWQKRGRRDAKSLLLSRHGGRGYAASADGALPAARRKLWLAIAMVERLERDKDILLRLLAARVLLDK